MVHDLRTFCWGMTAVLSTALMLTLLHPRNRRHLDLAIATLLFAGWIFYSASFLHCLLEGTAGHWALPLQWITGVAMATGLALMPSALLHSVRRMQAATQGPGRASGSLATGKRSGDWQMVHALLYLPVLCVIPASIRLYRDPAGVFLQTISPLVIPFVIWMITAAIGAGILLLRVRQQTTYLLYRKAALRIAISLFLLAGILLIGFFVVGQDRIATTPILALMMSWPPFIPGFVFAHLVIRYGFMRLMLEQAVVYGTIVLAALFLHQLTVERLTDSLREQLGIDFAVLEGAVVSILVLSYTPLRQRISESLRYLMGTRVAGVRARSQQLAVQLSRQSQGHPQALLEWFVPRLSDTFSVGFVGGWLVDSDSPVQVGTCELTSGRLGELATRMQRFGLTRCDRRCAISGELLDQLSEGDIDTALCTTSPQPAIFVFGKRPLGLGMTEEEVHAAQLLVEHFAVTLENRMLHEHAIHAEREALQSHKLKTLGMLSSCMAHEVKSPLSTIRTIASVMSEQMGGASEHVEDLRMIVSEVDRLSHRTSEMLGFARPAEVDQACDSIQEVVEATSRFFSHRARQRGVELLVDFGENLPALSADENSVRDILFNLIGNSLDAAKGRVTVECRRDGERLVTVVADDGPGIASEIAERLFEPFATTKPDGTGLGLYIVRQRVHALGGTIQCDSEPGEGTRFTLWLPIQRTAS